MIDRTGGHFVIRCAALRAMIAFAGLVSVLPGFEVAAFAPPDPGQGDRSAASDAAASARSLIDRKRFDEARGVLDRALATAPDDPALLALRGELGRASGRLEDARADYEHLARVRPSDADAWFWLGTIDRWKARNADAMRDYGHALELSPCYNDALKGRSRVRAAEKDVSGAENDLRAALMCNPRDSEAQDLLAASLAKRGDMAGAEEVLKAGSAAGTGAAGSGEGGAEAAGGAAGSSEAALERRLGDLAMAAGRPSEAIEHYNRASEIGPASADTYRGLGDAERQAGDSRAALAAYHRAVSIDPKDRASLYWIGVLATRAGNHDEAMEAFDAVLAMKPDDAAALVGKARLLRYDGRPKEALPLVDRALAADAENGEAHVLHAAILSSLGRVTEARTEYQQELARHPDDIDAAAGLSGLGPARSIGLNGRYSRSRVIEGLDEDGLLVGVSKTTPGFVIVPTRIEYLTEGAGSDLSWRLSDRAALASSLSLTRERVTNLDTDFPIYDFDILSATAGLDHRLSEAWRFNWRVGGARFSPRKAGTIATTTRFKGSAELGWTGASSHFTLAYRRAPFIERGFAGNNQFRIFDEDHLSADWGQELGRGFAVEAGAGISRFNNGDRPVYASAGVGWEKGEQAVWLRARHDPFPARFLGERDANGDGKIETSETFLDFINFYAVSLSGRTPLGLGFRLSGEALAGRYGATHRSVQALTVQDCFGHTPPCLVEGSLDHNTEESLRAGFAWTPRGFKPLSLGAEYFDDHFDFDTGPYNTINTHSWTLYGELAGRTRRLGYATRAGYGLVGDERDGRYTTGSLYGRLEWKLGSLTRPAGAPALGFEGEYRRNTLGDTSRSHERFDRFRVYFTLPF